MCNVMGWQAFTVIRGFQKASGMPLIGWPVVSVFTARLVSAASPKRASSRRLGNPLSGKLRAWGTHQGPCKRDSQRDASPLGAVSRRAHLGQGLAGGIGSLPRSRCGHCEFLPGYSQAVRGIPSASRRKGREPETRVNHRDGRSRDSLTPFAQAAVPPWTINGFGRHLSSPLREGAARRAHSHTIRLRGVERREVLIRRRRKRFRRADCRSSQGRGLRLAGGDSLRLLDGSAARRHRQSPMVEPRRRKWTSPFSGAQDRRKPS